MKKVSKIISIIIMIPFVIYFWPASYGGDTTVMMVQGQSMLPTILPGSIVVAKEAPEYNIDDIAHQYLAMWGSALAEKHSQPLVEYGSRNRKRRSME